MCSPSGHANLLTSPSDKTWKAVRQAIAQAFSFRHIKCKFPLIVGAVVYAFVCTLCGAWE